MKQKTIHIPVKDHNMKMIIMSYGDDDQLKPGILWIHGGGYLTGMASQVYISCGKMLVKKFGGTVISPGYILSFRKPYPAAFEDCYAALEYMWDHSDELRIDKDRIFVGGESAGGGLCVAVCLKARDEGKIKVRAQFPIYPMIDCFDTESSKDNHGKVWNTRKNHISWKIYLGDLYGKSEIPYYASPARCNNYEGMPPCYTFVCDGEPFYAETIKYVDDLNKAGVKAELDVYNGDMHGFDLLLITPKAKRARNRLCEKYRSYL